MGSIQYFFPLYLKSNINFDPVIGPIFCHFLLRQPIHHSMRLVMTVPQVIYFFLLN